MLRRPASRGLCDSTGTSTDFKTDGAGPAGHLAFDPVLTAPFGEDEAAAGADGG